MKSRRILFIPFTLWNRLDALTIVWYVIKKAIIHPWVDGPVDKNAVYGSKSYAHDFEKYPKVKRVPTLGESIFCGQCHRLRPNFELEHPSQCATLYGSYLYAYIPEGGHEKCQDCHMKKSGLGHDMGLSR